MLPDPREFDDLWFDPEMGQIVREPAGNGYGYWVGGHKAFYDQVSEQFVIFYRERSPLETGRGSRCAIAVGKDGVTFEEVWAANKEAFAASSIEVGHPVRSPDGDWRLYISYEVAGARYWRIDMLKGESLESLDVQGRRTVFQPTDFGLGSLKDPVVYLRDGRWWVYVAGPARERHPRRGRRVRANALDATLLGRSDDGLYFPELEWAFEAPGTDTWHGRRARINSVISYDNGWLALYDGGHTFYDTYEEWCGLAWSDDGVRFERLDQQKPWVRSPYGCVRYVFALEQPSAIYFYYEYTRADGSHDLRVSVVKR